MYDAGRAFVRFGVPRARKKERLPLYDLPEYRRVVAQLAANLRALRKDRGLTQQGAAELCEMSFHHYVAIEHAKSNITLVTLARICRGFGIVASEALLSEKWTLVRGPPRDGRRGPIIIKAGST
jgi:DNA-binding XRE family transcriptional regulator